MENFFDTVVTVLKLDERFFTADGELLRNAVYESAMKMDSNLLKLLYQNETTRNRFFTDVDGISVFDKVGFGWVINNRSFLPDSYTRFKNKVGLTNANGDYISTSNDVSLVFPYKDCVLEGGQTKEDQKRSEVFYNETLAPDEVDRLLYPKVLTNPERHSKNGIESVSNFENTDNLIIKGNNLLSISLLLQRYENQIKLIYIDPPYNTGGDANIFSYNNTFNHSTWLTFMKNRLDISKRLLKDDGFIVIAIDHAELFYLGTLADEIFGRDNFISIITVQHNPKGRNQSKFFSANSEFLLVYAKNKPLADFYSVAISEDVKATFTEKDDVSLYRWESYIRARTVWSREARPENWYPIYVSKDLKTISSSPIADAYELYPTTNTGDFSWKNIKSTFDELNVDGNFRAILENGKVVLQHKYREQEVLKNVWIDKKYQSEFNGTNLLKDLIGKNGFSYPKSLYAVMDIIKIMSGKGDIVLDFFGGSGTTAHAVLEANKEQNISDRRFILCEQLDEHIDIINRRLRAVLSKNENDDSFICCELLKSNQTYVEQIEVATDDNDLVGIWNDMLKSGFISCKINPSDVDFESKEFTDLSLDDKKKFLMEMLDKNQLYVNYCDMEDETFAVSEEDKAFTNSFYGEM